MGRHRVKIKASGQHKQDPLPPPDIPYRPPRTGLVSSEPEGRWSQWHDPSQLRGIDPDLVSPLQEIHHDEPPTAAIPPWMQPARKIRPQYIAASVATALVAVPALLMAGWIAHESQAADAATRSISSQLSQGTVHMPLVLVVNGHPQPVCITLSDSGPQWTAWANPKKC